MRSVERERKKRMKMIVMSERKFNKVFSPSERERESDGS
jgi:hypothetical protein